MAVARIQGVRVKGLACAVPERTRSVEDDARAFGQVEIDKISKSTGILRRPTTRTLCASDLCQAAAERLLDRAGWERGSIDLLVMVTQTPDHRLPATSCVLHGKLGLGKGCATFDVNLGCSGYVYGLWIAAQMVASGSVQRALLLVGDTVSRTVSPEDRAVAVLFGDAGSATLLEADPGAPPMVFTLGTDGTGYQHLIIPAGGFRQPSTPSSGERVQHPDGNARSDDDLYMAGAEVFTFTIREVPPLVRGLLSAAGWTADHVDAFLFHQANEFMVRYLAKTLRLPGEKVVVAVKERGNTSGASIPLAMADTLAARLGAGPIHLALVGFGVGLSWAAAAITLGPMLVPEVVTVPEPESAAVP